MFIHSDNTGAFRGRGNAILSKAMKNPFNFQSKKNAYTSTYMGFVGFMVKDITTGIVPMSSFKIVFCTPECGVHFRMADPNIQFF